VKITRTTKAAVAGFAAVAVTVLCTASSCSSSNSANTAINASANTSVEQTIDNSQPAPVFEHSDIRDTAADIEAIQALGENTTSFAFLPGSPNPIWSCPSLGEPVASTTEITNPDQVDPDTNPGHSNSTAETLPNMDPNGVYAGDSTGTYVLCVNSKGQQYANYWEGDVESVSGPAYWDPQTRQVVMSGTPTMPTCTVETVKGKAATVCSK
jgi:hypothetical protein